MKGSIVLKSSLIFTALGFLRPGLSFLLLPLYLQYLNPEDYGFMALLTIFSTVLSLIGNLRLDTAMRTDYFDYCHDNLLVRKYLLSITTFLVLLSLGWLILFSIIGPYLFDAVYFGQIDFYPYGFISCLGVLSAMCINPFYIFLRNKIDLNRFVSLTLINIFLSVSIQLYLVTVENLGVLGIISGTAIGNLLIMIFILIKYQLISFKAFTKPMIISSLSFSVPLLPFVFFDQLIVSGDKYIISAILNLEQTGLYAVLMTIAGVIHIVLNALDNALRPTLFELFKSGVEKNKKQIMSYYNLYLLIGIICLFGVLLVGNNLDYITDDPKYLSIKPYFGMTILSMLPLFLVRIFNLQLLFYKKSKEISRLTFYKALIILSLFIVLVPTLEIWGAILALTISNMLSAVIFGYKVYPLMKSVYDWSIYWLLGIVFASFVMSFYLFDFEHPSLVMIIQFITLLIICSVIYLKRLASNF